MKQITEDYVSFETAKLLKEKGFDEICSYEWGIPDIDKGYVLQKWTITNGQIKNSDLIDRAYTAPSQSLALKWLREVHNLHIWFGHSVNKGLAWYYEIHGISDGKVKHIGGIQCGSYEVACETALKYTLENLI